MLGASKITFQRWGLGVNSEIRENRRRGKGGGEGGERERGREGRRGGWKSRTVFGVENKGGLLVRAVI